MAFGTSGTNFPTLQASAIPSPRSPPTARAVITKPAGTGGLVSVGTVTEQLLYEIDDPARYRTPDVDVDFTTVRLIANEPDRVAVRDATADRLLIVSSLPSSTATAGPPAARWPLSAAVPRKRPARPGRCCSSACCGGVHVR